MTDREPILVEREKTHGSFAENARIWQSMCNLAKDGRFCNDSQRLAVEMIFLKLGRLIQNPAEPDHWRDIAGYAKLGEEACK